MDEIVLMKQAAYARHRGVTRQAIGKLVKAGRIAVDAEGKIDVAAADLELGLNVARLNEPATLPASPAEAAGLTKARTETEQIRARVAELQYLKAIGKVVPTEGVAAAAAQCAETMQRVVRRLSANAEALHAAGVKSGVAGVRVALKAIERDVAEQLSQAFETLAAEAAAATDDAADAPLAEDGTE